jgi:hypothetical protein
MYKFTACGVILSDGNAGEILVTLQTELAAQRTTLPSHDSEKRRLVRAYLMLDACELSILNTELINIILSDLELYYFVIIIIQSGWIPRFLPFPKLCAVIFDGYCAFNL